MTKILHIIETLSLGGAARSLLATSKYSQQQSEDYEFAVVSLLPALEQPKELAKEANVTVIDHPSDEVLFREITSADIVQVHYWNNPFIVHLLCKKLPPCRLILFYHIAGDRMPQVIVPELLKLADWNIPCSPYTEKVVNTWKDRIPSDYLDRTTMIYGATDFERLKGIRPKPHEGFRVGYIGTVNFLKMHPSFVSMSSSVRVPEVKFVVCGGDSQQELLRQAKEMGTGEKFEFHGYVQNIRHILETLDVYGFPLREDTYAAAELNLQEAMYAGVPPVVFPHGGIKYLVEHGKNGLIVQTEQEYSEAIEYLYHSPDIRAELANQAQKYAKREFGAENAAKKIRKVYNEVMKSPKNPHYWGIDTHHSLLNDSINLKNLVYSDSQKTESRLFLESTGEYGKIFSDSVAPFQSLKGYLNADMKISRVSLLVYQTGLEWYLNRDSSDPRLNFWVGLYLMGLRDTQRAIVHFSNAWSNGFDHWRVLWYLRELLIIAGNKKDAERVDRMLNETHSTWKQELKRCGITVTVIEREPDDSMPGSEKVGITAGTNSPYPEPVASERQSTLMALVRSEVRLAQIINSDVAYLEMLKHLLALAQIYPGDPLLENEIAEYYYKKANFKASALWYQKALNNASHDDYTFIFTIIERLAEMGKIAEAVGYVSRNEAQLSKKPGFQELLDSLTQYASQG